MTNLIRAVGQHRLGSTSIYQTEIAQILQPNFGAVIFVRPHDKGPGTGSQRSPYAHIGLAISSASRGDTVVVSGVLSAPTAELRAAIGNKQLRIYAGFDTDFAALRMPAFNQRKAESTHRSCPPLICARHSRINDPKCNEVSRS